MNRVGILAIAMSIAAATGSVAGTLQGLVVVPEHTRAAGHANPYPGRAGSVPMPMTGMIGLATDAVVYVDHLSKGADSTLAAVRRPRPRLSQQGQAFAPRVVAVAAGSSVDFPNLDPIYHNVFSLSPAKRFDLGKYPRGQSRTVTFDKPGLINVFCDIHSDMAGYILVAPNHGFTQPSGDGEFSIANLPAGHYVATAWHPDFGTLERPIDVPATGTVTVEFRFGATAPARASDD